MIVWLVVSLIIFIGDGVPFGLMVILGVLFGGLIVGGVYLAIQRERRLPLLARVGNSGASRRRQREAVRSRIPAPGTKQSSPP